MIQVKKEGVLFKKTSLNFESKSVLNPAVISEGKSIHLFYRAVGKNNYSSIGHCKLAGPLTVEKRDDIPLLLPRFEYESHGMEDPRIVKIDDLFYLTYTAYDGENALGALAVSKDLKHFEKLGLIVPQITYDEFSRCAECKCAINKKYLRYNGREHIVEKQGKKIFIWDKDVMFFPRRINNKLYFLHRVKPDIQVVAVNDLKELNPEFWQNYFMNLEEGIVLSPKYEHETSYLGGGCPPIETEHGWLLIYHSVQDTIKGYVYSACAALLDLENPQKEIVRLPYALFKPELDWEINGEVNNVCFPSGTLLLEETLYIYYGAADEQIACASVSIAALLEELMLTAQKDGR